VTYGRVVMACFLLQAVPTASGGDRLAASPWIPTAGRRGLCLSPAPPWPATQVAARPAFGCCGKRLCDEKLLRNFPRSARCRGRSAAGVIDVHELGPNSPRFSGQIGQPPDMVWLCIRLLTHVDVVGTRAHQTID